MRSERVNAVIIFVLTSMQNSIGQGDDKHALDRVGYVPAGLPFGDLVLVGGVIGVGVIAAPRFGLDGGLHLLGRC